MMFPLWPICRGLHRLPMRSIGQARRLATRSRLFPDYGRVASSAVRAVKAVRAALQDCPEELHHDVLHRLKAKEAQLVRVIYLSLGVEVRCRTAETFLVPGQSSDLTLEVDAGSAKGLDVGLDLPEDWTIDGDTLRIGDDASLSAPYQDFYDPAQADLPSLCG